MNCLKCNNILLEYCPTYDRVKYFCMNCNEDLVIRESISNLVLNKSINYPINLDIGDAIFIINERHPLFLERGEIIDVDDFNYRIKIILGEQHQGKIIWVHKSWVELSPKELLS